MMSCTNAAVASGQSNVAVQFLHYCTVPNRNNIAKMYQSRLIPPAFGALELENELQYRGLAMRDNSDRAK